MEENKVMETFNGEVVNQVCEEVTSSNKNVALKLGVGAVVVTAAGYGVYRLYKKVKNRKHDNENVEVEYDVNDNNE